MDLDGDGRRDFLTATYDGAVHWAPGVEGGFDEPRHLLDRTAERIGLRMMWDKDEGRWRDVFASHATSVCALDWDGDGDLDLLLGDKSDGGLHLCRAGEGPLDQRYDGTSTPVRVGGEPLALVGGVTVVRVVDWDADGRFDLVCGSHGDEHPETGPPQGGGVWLLRNVGERTAPRFDRATPLIEPGPPRSDRPWMRLYPDPVDYDGDGDLDLLVGGYAAPSPPPAPRAVEVETQRPRKPRRPKPTPGVWVFLQR